MSSRAVMPARLQRAYEEFCSWGPRGNVTDTVMMFDGRVMLGVRPMPRSTSLQLAYFWISPDTRGMGYGTRALEKLCSLADAHTVPIQLRPAAFDRRDGTGLSTVQLRSWYARYGFRRAHNGEPERLVRKPAGDPWQGAEGA